MSSNSSQRPPAWLFSHNSINSSHAPSASREPATMKKTDEKARKAAKPKAAPKAAAASTSASTSHTKSSAPPTQLMDLVESFLSDQGFDNAHREFQKHRARKGWKEQDHEKDKNKGKTHHSLVSVFQTWKTFASQGSTPVSATDDPMAKITKISSSSSDSSESDSSEDSSSESESDSDADDVAMDDAPAADGSSEESSSSESSSDSESDEGKKPRARPATNSLKRKAQSDSDDASSESSSEEDMSDSSSEDERPQAKKAKIKSVSDEGSSSSEASDSSSSDDESSSDEDEAEDKSDTKSDDSSSGSESDSDSSESGSESKAESKVDLKVAAQVPLPESSSSSDLESEYERPRISVNANVARRAESDTTSATLDKTSPDNTLPPLPPDPLTFKANNRGKNGVKGQNQPFSRIPKDVVVDPRLSSNAYVAHGYGEKAHQDLVVTKGKGFTKEKNKKKRGSYKGGPLDINQTRSIKFDD
ncbi:hypothetical protein GGS23DRAFT_362713 [Durotheca rogersii]|uniref:uncharacterized protein n=1 Tax=Durotheca rogersii TaxID=419775 RepID=UPI002220EC1F|nr:uncharacterized protein GGS23DRAFT_362713 [Durotheca rogersii]KAI5865969.1 hypothetical protein GGS23DRAFT_362713 [Durotheca rogersii]